MSIETKEGRIFTISIQNETITAQYEDETCIKVTGPDSICFLSTKNGVIPQKNIYDNTLIEENYLTPNGVEIAVVAIEADAIVLENKTLMNAWKDIYKEARYYGAYNAGLWK